MRRARAWRATAATLRRQARAGAAAAVAEPDPAADPEAARARSALARGALARAVVAARAARAARRGRVRTPAPRLGPGRGLAPASRKPRWIRKRRPAAEVAA